MSKKTQGTKLYFIDTPTTVLEIGCVTTIDGIDAPVEQIETTCLQDLARSYTTGLANPGAASFSVLFDPADATHVKLMTAKTAGTTLKFALGWSDGTAPPTSVASVYTLPSTRSWLTFDGFIESLPFSFPLNAVVSSSLGIKLTSAPALTIKV